MAKIGRNQPCPCGSGKKYKKCCLAADEAKRPAIREPPPSPSPTLLQPGSDLFGPDDDLWGPEDEQWVLADDPLDELSNSVIDLIDQKRFDEADEVCAQLRRDYPEVVDGLWRQAMVYEARGMGREAADYYRQSADFARANEGFEEEGIAHWMECARKLDPDAPAS
jgi:hypothetical protein